MCRAGLPCPACFGKHHVKENTSMKDPVKLCGKATIIAVSIIFALAIIGDVIGSTAAHYICYGLSSVVLIALCIYVIIYWKCPYCKKGLPFAVMEFCPYCGKRIHYKDDTENKE